MLTSLIVRLRATLLRRRADDDLDEELRYHLDREIERNVSGGMPPHEARAAAKRALGNTTVATEEARDAMRWRWVEELQQDVAYGFRTFKRAPLFVAGVVGTIGLGLGLLSAAFTFFDAYVLRPFTVRDPYSLYELSWESRDGGRHVLTWPQYRRLEQASRTGTAAFSETFALATDQSRLRGRVAFGQLVTGNYFEMLGVPPALGRVLVPSDAAAPGGNAVVVLGYGAWRTMFGGDTGVIGTHVAINGVSFTVVGVAREGFGGLGSVPFDYWIPMTMIGAVGPVRELFGARQPEGVHVIGRLRAGMSTQSATAGLTTWLRAETADRPVLRRVGNVQLLARATSIPMTSSMLAVFAPVGAAFLLVMLIACANVANMMLARGMVRQREIGIRLALGAGRGRIVRQLLTESVLLAMPAGVAGFVVSRAAIAVSLGVMFSTVPHEFTSYLRIVPLDLDARVLLFMLAAAVGAAVLFGLAPALQATRPNIVQASRGDFDTQFRPSRLRNTLVVAQVTVSVLLLVSAGVLLSGARHTEQLEPGIRTRNVVQIELSSSASPDVLDALRREAIIRDIATSSSTPLDGGFSEVSLIAAGKPSVRASYLIVSPSYFNVLDLPLVHGRTFSDDEARSSEGVVIVSRSTASRFWPNADPIGQTLAIAPTDRDYRFLASHHTARVIGVVGDAVPGWIGKSPTDPTVYYPGPLDRRSSRLLVRVGVDGATAAAALERTIAAVDSSAIQEIHTLETSIALQVYPFRAMYWVASALGTLALVLTLSGVYAVLAYVVTQRRKEFGVRLALGASGASVVAMVLRESVRLCVRGSVVGMVLALGVSALLHQAFWRLFEAFDVLGYLLGPATVLVACLIAAYVPSRRAAAVSPVDALRADS